MQTGTVQTVDELAQLFNSKLQATGSNPIEPVELSQLFNSKLQVTGSSRDEPENESQPSDEEEEFSFSTVRFSDPSVSADDVFSNGQITPIFPFFDRSLLISGEYSGDGYPPVKVFVAAAEEEEEDDNTTAVEASPETCEKSKSTGFSRTWRLNDPVHRSNSDGRDTFVFLKSPEKFAGAGVKAKKKTKSEKGSITSAHEKLYVSNKAVSEKNRRKSYLPYRPELFGFFTNVRGGLRKDVNPF